MDPDISKDIVIIIIIISQFEAQAQAQTQTQLYIYSITNLWLANFIWLVHCTGWKETNDNDNHNDSDCLLKYVSSIQHQSRATGAEVAATFSPFASTEAAASISVRVNSTLP